MSAYRAMVAASQHEGLPRRFQTDLTRHDRHFVAKLQPGQRFYWMLYEHGTHVIRVDGQGAKDVREIRSFLKVIGTLGSIPPCFFFWDGAQLQRLGDAASAIAHCDEVLTRSSEATDAR